MKTFFWLVCFCSNLSYGAQVESSLSIDAEDGIPQAIIDVIKERHARNELHANLEFATGAGKIQVLVMPHFVGGSGTLFASPDDFKKWFDAGANPSDVPKSYTQHGPSKVINVQVRWVKPKQ